MTSSPEHPPEELPALARRLFDSSVAVAEVDPRQIDPEHVLMPVERDAVARAIESRRRQYAAGRYCARSAMDALSVPKGPVTQDDDRAPRFPSGLVGTITHTQWWCAAAVALESSHAALGIDVEPDSPLKASLFDRVLTPDEIKRLDTVADDALRGLVGKLIFSAKECAYKCQYTLSRTFYGFHGMEVELPSLTTLTALPQEGEWRAMFLRDAGPFRVGDSLQGRYVHAHRYVMTGVELHRGR